MITGFPRLLFVRLWAALLLATVALQAGLPAGEPLERAHGSAFSATTAEVALAPHRRVTEAARLVAPDPRLPPVEPQPLRAEPATQRPDLPEVQPDSTGPPPFAPLASRVAPRAPPYA